VKYGLAILWDGPYDKRELDEAYASALYDCTLIKLAEINLSLLKNQMPPAAFVVIARDDKDLKKI